jgi:hypothetical protein
MTTEEITDAEIVDEPSTSLERVAPTAPTSLFRTDDPVEVVAKATQIADALKAPLGFVVALAGYETTPAEEMSAGRRSTRVNVRPGRAAIADTYVEDFESEADGLASQLLLLASDKDRALQAIHAKRGELAPGLFLDWLGAEIAKRTVAA